MPQLTPLLRQITKNASHPNGLLYGMQLERARVKSLVKGELEGGTQAVALDVPKEKVQEMTVEEKFEGNVDVKVKLHLEMGRTRLVGERGMRS